MNGQDQNPSGVLQKSWTVLMFVTLWLSVLLSGIFLVPIHKKTMADWDIPTNAFLDIAIILQNPIFTVTALYLVAVAIIKFCQRKKPACEPADRWQSVLMTVLVLAVIFLNFAYLSAWFEYAIYIPNQK